MKSKENLLYQLNLLPHFTKDTVYRLGEQLGLRKSTVDTYISRFLKRKEIIRLKKGLYISSVFYSTHVSDMSYLFCLANILRTPSYVSSWTALQYYNLTTEVIHPIISTTTKVTRTQETKVGTFSYQSIRNDLFSDYVRVNGAFDFFIATPSKALFDLLYFRTRQFRGVNRGDIDRIVEELRIDIDEINDTERSKFYTYIKEYIHE